MVEFELNHSLFPNRLTISSTSRDLDQILEAVNLAIKTETAKDAEKFGLTSPLHIEYSKTGLLDRFDYRCIEVTSTWFQHTFSDKFFGSEGTLVHLTRH